METSTLRAGSFFIVLVLMLVFERRWPRRSVPDVPGRIASNLGIVAVGQVVVRLLVPVLPAALAAQRWADGAGLLAGVSWPVAMVASILALDLLIWAQHLAFHRVPVLWRLHRMHHADTGFDTTTALRFHPVEILLSVGVKLAAIAVLGPPPEAVVAFEIILNGMAMFNHANLALPAGVDAALRLVFVTPDVHRVHHSVWADELHTNFGFNLVWWDRLFGTWTAAPRDGHVGMQIGLPQFRSDGEHLLPAMLTQPFRTADAASGPEAPRLAQRAG